MLFEKLFPVCLTDSVARRKQAEEQTNREVKTVQAKQIALALATLRSARAKRIG